MDHRLGYPDVIDHVEYAIDPEHVGAEMRNNRSAWTVFTVERDSARFRKMLATHTPENDAKETAKHDLANPLQAHPPCEPAYRPEFDFQYIDRRGHLGALIPKRPDVVTFRALVDAAAGLDPLDELAERVVNDEGMYRLLRDHRGGCTCFISPPCGACSNPLTLAEAEALGWLEEDAPALDPGRVMPEDVHGSEPGTTPLAPSRPVGADWQEPASS